MDAVSSVTGGTVHPHGRGDNLSDAQITHVDIGSPPRAWGQLVQQKGGDGMARFTPTGVETIVIDAIKKKPETVHPHGRGDNTRSTARLPAIRGSPPRAWGQSIVDSGEDRNLRFTPTGVGTMASA